MGCLQGLLFLVFLLPIISQVYGILVVKCDDAYGEIFKQDVNDAIEVLQVVYEFIKRKKHDHKVVGAAFGPLFDEEDWKRVKEIIKKAGNVETHSDTVTIYCNKDHIQWDQEHGWYEEFADHARGNAKVGLPYRIKDQNKHPTDLGSLTFIGNYERNVDIRDQTHITILPSDWKENPAGKDSRRFQEVRAGLLEGYIHLDQIQPRGYIIIHELMHWAGGRGSDGRVVIRDNDSGDPLDPRLYGWRTIASAKEQNPNLDTTKIADSYALFVKAMYLQIRGERTLWHTGAVDRHTLQPYPPPPPDI